MTWTPDAPLPPIVPRPCPICGVLETVDEKTGRIILVHDAAKHTPKTTGDGAAPLAPAPRVGDDEDDDRPLPRPAIRATATLSPMQRVSRMLGERDDED